MQLDLNVQDAIELFDSVGRIGRAPTLAVLGPPGSGKSNFLQRLLEARRSAASARAREVCLRIDLRRAPTGSVDDIYGYVYRTLWTEARAAAVQHDYDGSEEQERLRFRALLENMLKSCPVNYLIIFFDHINCVSRDFANDLHHTFRHFIESAVDRPLYQRLGFVVAGTVSLFRMRQEIISAYTMFDKMILLPHQDPNVCRYLVEEQLKIYLPGTGVPPDVLDLLAEETGGEPAFLEPTLGLLRQGRPAELTTQLVQDAIAQLCARADTPALRQVALHVWGDRALLDIVRGLRRGDFVRTRDLHADIDLFHLTGAVVVDRRARPYESYRFRNKMVGGYLTSLLDTLEQNNGHPTTLTSLPILAELRRLEELKTAVRAAPQLWKCTKLLREAWELTTHFRQPPDLQFYVGARDPTAQGWWLEAGADAVNGPLGREVASARSATQRAAYLALDNSRTAYTEPFFEWDNDQAAVALSLSFGDPQVVLVATRSHEEVGREFNEFALVHWIRFLRELKEPLATLVLAQLGKRAALAQPIVGPAVALPRVVPPRPALEPRRVKRLHFLSDFGALLEEHGRVLHFPGKLDARQMDEVNLLCQEMVDQKTKRQSFQLKLREVARRFEEALRAVPGLWETLISAGRADMLVIMTAPEGLALPFELLRYDKSPLALRTSLARHIAGYQVAPEVCMPLTQLLANLRADGKRLRVLLVASEAGGKLPQAEAELVAVRRHIEEGCREEGLEPPEVVVLAPDQAKVEAIEYHLLDDRPFHLLHFVGHAVHEPDDLDSSGLVLRGSRNEPALLTAERLRELTTEAGLWLVYMSTCYSAAADSMDDGATYLGLVEALVAAGVANIVGFRWRISDTGSCNLASEFYRQLFVAPQAQRHISRAMLAARTRTNGRGDSFDAWAASMLITQVI